MNDGIETRGFAAEAAPNQSASESGSVGLDSLANLINEAGTTATRIAYSKFDPEEDHQIGTVSNKTVAMVTRAFELLAKAEQLVTKAHLTPNGAARVTLMLEIARLRHEHALCMQHYFYMLLVETGAWHLADITDEFVMRDGNIVVISKETLTLYNEANEQLHVHMDAQIERLAGGRRRPERQSTERRGVLKVVITMMERLRPGARGH
jgi:hypothetical protein